MLCRTMVARRFSSRARTESGQASLQGTSLLRSSSRAPGRRRVPGARGPGGGALATRMLISTCPSVTTLVDCWGSMLDLKEPSPCEPPLPKPPIQEPLPPRKVPPPTQAVPGTSLYAHLPYSALEGDGRLAYPQALVHGFAALKDAGVDGVVVPVLWGLVERDGAMQYDFGLYRQLADMLQACGLKMQAVLEFSEAEGVAGLPPWVLDVGEVDPDIFYKDQYGNVLPGCLSLGVDTELALGGRTGLGVYQDFMEAFSAEFSEELSSVITEVIVGAGPHAELRYPSYPAGKWHFPGVGEFQCYDRHLAEGLRGAAEEVGEPDWGKRGPEDCGHYCVEPQETAFFWDEGSWTSEHGQFFLEWYSQQLLQHGDRLLGAAAAVFGNRVAIGLKIPVVHWWFNTKSHAAELTAGIYNTEDRDGYRPLVELAAKHNAFLQISCGEMRDKDQDAAAKCGPEQILAMVRRAASELQVPIGLENCFERFDDTALNQLAAATLDPNHTESTKSLTFFSMDDELFKGYQWGKFKQFLGRVRPPCAAVEPGAETSSSSQGAAAVAAAASSSSSCCSPGSSKGAPGKETAPRSRGWGSLRSSWRSFVPFLPRP